MALAVFYVTQRMGKWCVMTRQGIDNCQVLMMPSFRGSVASPTNSGVVGLGRAVLALCQRQP